MPARGAGTAAPGQASSPGGSPLMSLSLSFRLTAPKIPEGEKVDFDVSLWGPDPRVHPRPQAPGLRRSSLKRPELGLPAPGHSALMHSRARGHFSRRVVPLPCSPCTLSPAIHPSPNCQALHPPTTYHPPTHPSSTHHPCFPPPAHAPTHPSHSYVHLLTRLSNTSPCSPASSLPGPCRTALRTMTGPSGS